MITEEVRNGSEKIAEIHQRCCQQSIETVLEHFGISHKELSKTEPFSEVKNNPNTRKAYGIDRILKNRRIQKARIIIDYDADFPEIVIRVFSKDSQKHQYRVEEKKRQDKTEEGERNESRGY